MHQHNFVLARAWDEGSADAYSYLYDKNENFMEISFPNTMSATFRKVDGDLTNSLRPSHLFIKDLMNLNNYRCLPSVVNAFESERNNSISEDKLFYRIGSDFTKILVKLAKTRTMQAKFGKNAYYQLISAYIKSLDRLNDYLQNHFLGTFMSPLQPIKYIIEELEIENAPDVCKLINEVYGTEYCGRSEEEKENV
jgi:hypothetical protein